MSQRHLNQGPKLTLLSSAPTYPQTPTFKPRREKMLRHFPVTYISIRGDLRNAMTFHLTSCVGSSPATPLELSCPRKQKPLWLTHRLSFCSCQALLMRLSLFRLAFFMLPEISVCPHFLYKGSKGPIWLGWYPLMNSPITWCMGLAYHVKHCIVNCASSSPPYPPLRL